MKVSQTAFFSFLFSLIFSVPADAQVWQWSAILPSVVSDETKDHPTAYLWIPEDCRYVRGVIVGQHNMLEEGIFEHPDFRKKMAQLGFAIVWVTPNFDITFDFNKGAGERFQEMMDSLAVVSGYQELKFAPIVPVGHSALASYPWNFAAWNPGRTLAVLSIHGDAPLTPLTGSGRPNPDWGNRTITGVPGLMVMGEYEWWENRIIPGFDYVLKHPGAAVSFFCDAGRGHFDYSDQMVNYLCLFLEKAAKYRLPKQNRADTVVLKAIEPEKGWLMDRWRRDSLPTAIAAPYGQYKGSRYTASWCFDKAMSDTTEKIYQHCRGKRQQYIGYVQNDTLVSPQKTHGNYQLVFNPLADGVSFYVKAMATDSTRMKVTRQHAASAVSVNRICGPVLKINDTTFQLSFYRMGFNSPKRSNDIWFLASNDGDAAYKSIVQQADMRFPLNNKEGRVQKINFPAIADQKQDQKTIELMATSDAGLPVHYYVKEGPAVVKGNALLFTKLPPRSALPVKVTIVAWQYGRIAGDKIRTAVPVEKFFFIF